MARNPVPVYSRNAVSTRETALHYTTKTEAEQLIADGKARRVSRPSAPLKIQLIELVTPDINSPCSLTFYVMEANAGVYGAEEQSRVSGEIVGPWNACGQPRLVAATL